MDKQSRTVPTADLAPAQPQGSRVERLADRIYENLFHAIVTGRVAVGARLPPENVLAAEFDVSRPVLREALDRLRADGLISSVRGSGNYVRSAVSMQSGDNAGGEVDHAMRERIGMLLNGIELRLIIEPKAAALAARRRSQSDIERMGTALANFSEAMEQSAILHHHDYAFHEAIAMATANPRIVQTLKSLEYDVARSVDLMRFLVRFRPLRRSDMIHAEHETIFRHIEAGDAKRAKRAMRNHIEHARTRMMSSRTDI